MGMYDRDPPRVCGEKQLAVVVLSLTHRITPAYAGKSRTRRCWTKTTAGSPPRMRGKAPDIQQEKPETGITPAYAGKRACTAVCSTNATGSPPRMRGKAFPQGVHVVVVGITPAYAGKSHADHQRRQLA